MKNLLQFVSSKKIFIIASIIVLSVLYILISDKDTTSSNASNASEKYYTSIMVESGDTLWSIADEYMTEEYDSYQEYINEVMELNNLTDSNIVKNTYLLVPYYEVRDFQ